MNIGDVHRSGVFMVTASDTRAYSARRLEVAGVGAFDAVERSDIEATSRSATWSERCLIGATPRTPDSGNQPIQARTLSGPVEPPAAVATVAEVSR